MTQGRAKTKAAKEAQLEARVQSGITRAGEKMGVSGPALFDALERIRTAEARLKEARAEKEEIENATRSRKLVSRDEARAEVLRLAAIVRGSLDRARAYLDPGLSPENRAICERALADAITKLRQSMAAQGLEHNDN